MREIPTIPNSMPSVRLEIRHEVPLPALCPQTGNPQPGSILYIDYIPAERLVDVFGIKDVVADYIGSQTIRDIEYMLQHLADRLARTLGVMAILQAQVILDIDQTMTIKAIASPS